MGIDTMNVSLAERLVSSLKVRGKRIAFAESCTGGMLAYELTEVPGASNVFEAGVVTYSNRMKAELLGVDLKVVEEHGAVSGQTVKAMAEGMLKRSGADIVVATSGIAGPEGGTDDKPVGLVWFGVATREDTHCVKEQFDGDRATVRGKAVAKAMALALVSIEGVPKPASD